MCFELRSSNKLQSPRLYEQARTTLGSIACGRWRFRTADLFGVNEARYHCANRPSEEGVYRTLNDIANLASVAAAPGGQSALATWFADTEPLICVCRRGCTSVLNAPNGADREIQARKRSADVAQLVEHHLAKVRVASSNLVVRSEISLSRPSTGREKPPSRWSGREARQRTANPCTRVQIPSPPRAVGAVVARFLDTEEVASSNLASPTEKLPLCGKKGTREGAFFFSLVAYFAVRRPSVGGRCRCDAGRVDARAEMRAQRPGDGQGAQGEAGDEHRTVSCLRDIERAHE